MKDWLKGGLIFLIYTIVLQIPVYFSLSDLLSSYQSSGSSAIALFLVPIPFNYFAPYIISYTLNIFNLPTLINIYILVFLIGVFFGYIYGLKKKNNKEPYYPLYFLYKGYLIFHGVLVLLLVIFLLISNIACGNSVNCSLGYLGAFILIPGAFIILIIGTIISFLIGVNKQKSNNQ